MKSYPGWLVVMGMMILALAGCASPEPDEVKFAKRIVDAMPDGSGAVMIDGKMQDDATWKQARVILDRARLVAQKEPDMAARYGL